MGLESATFISELVATNPVGATDPKSQGDDHLRMLKAVLQAQFPNLGAEAVTATAAQINNVIASGITGFANPSTSIGLTANNGSGTTAMRANATPALSQAIAPTWTGVHKFTAATGVIGEAIVTESATPYCSWRETDATANNRLWYAGASNEQFRMGASNDAGSSVQNFLLVERTAQTIDSVGFTATTLTHNGNVVPHVAMNVTWTGNHTFSGALDLSSASPTIEFLETDASANNKRWFLFANAEQFVGSVATDAGAEANWLAVNRTAGAVDSINFPNGELQYSGIEVGYRLVPRVTGALEHGKCFATSAGMTLNTSDMAAGRTFSIYNDSGSAITLTQGSGVTLRLGGTATTGNRTIAARGLATIWCNSGTEAVVSGHVS